MEFKFFILTFSFFSLFMAILFGSIFLVIISIVRKNLLFFKSFSISFLLFLLLLCTLRIIFPFEFPFVRVINCTKILPAIQSLVRLPILGNITLFTLLMITWFGITFIKIVKYINSYYYLRKTLNLLPATTNNQMYDILKKVSGKKKTHIKIVVHSSIQSPAVLGFLSPILILPNENYTDDELYGILTHEWAHIQYKHTYIKLATDIICFIFWWNPIFHLLSSEISHILEMHSDKKVCETLNSKQQRTYLEVILKTTKNMDSEKFSFQATCSLTQKDTKKNLSQRFRMILENAYTKKTYKHILLYPIVILVFLLSYTVVFQPYSEPTPDDYEPGYISIIKENDYLIKDHTGYKIYSSDGDFITHTTTITDDLKNLKIYNSIEEKKQ